MRKTCGGWGKKGVLFFFGLFYFRDVVQATKYWQAQYVFTTESHLPLAGHAPHVSCFVPKVISKHRTKPNQRPKAERGMSKRMSQHILQETGILVPIGSGTIRVRIWVLQWEGRKKRKPPRTPVKSFINFLVLTVSRKGVVAAIECFHMTSLKIQTTKLSFLLRFYFHGALEQLKTYFQTNFRFKGVLGFVIEYAWISKLLRGAAFTWRTRELSFRLKKWLFSPGGHCHIWAI